MKKNILLIGLCILLTGCSLNNQVSNETTGERNTKTAVKENTTNLPTTVKNEVSTTTTKEKTTTNKTTTTTFKKTSTTNKTTTTTKKSTTSKKTTTTKPTTTTKKPATTTKPITTTTKPITTTKPTTTTQNPTTTKAALTESSVYNAMIALKSKYPTGTPWDNSNYYAWNGGIYSGGYGCAGFAFMLSDAAFGTRKAKKITTFDNIKVGDIIRMYNDTHYVIVLSISGETYTIAEGNMNSAVYWGRKISLSEIKSTGTYILTRW